MSFIMFILVSLPLSFATMVVKGVNCPQEFKGQVKDIIEDLGPGSAFAKQQIIFKNLQTMKGQVGEQLAIDVLKHGPVHFEIGYEYKVQLREGRICWIEQI
jgi:hypothetical protein